MERKLNLPIYIGAFLISLAIFAAGVLVGNLIDRSNLDGISDELVSVSSRIASTQLLLLMEGNSSSFCPIFLSDLGAIDAEVERVGYKLSYLEDQKGVSDPELKKQYFTLEANSYLLSNKVGELCGSKSVLVINFYSNSNCSQCRQQGTEILAARDGVPGVPLKLFSFDGDLGSPAADAFKRQFGVSGYPSVVINGRLYEGFQNSEKLKAAFREAWQKDGG
jgi:hypothetical protein